MNIRILLGTGLLLTVGTAVAGTLIYGQGSSASTAELPAITLSATSTVTPEVIAAWAATDSSDDDYIAPKVPI